MKTDNLRTNADKTHVAFINKWLIFALSGVAVVIMLACSWLLVKFHDELPLPFTIIWFLMVIIVLISWLMIPFNGLKVSRKGTVVFVSDLRVTRVKIDDLVSLNISFLQWENGKYSTCVEITCKNGKYFKKDYSLQFKNLKRKQFLMSMYTISKQRVENIEQNFKDIPHCNISYAVAV